ncbi:MAG TPA: hypothetical protein VKZ98_06065 [Aquaticitalea sp.]|nr:hypothetical protein [Aquaticitalea sp.]
MKTQKFIIICLVFAFVVNSACRKEEMEFEQAPPEDTLSPNSQVAQLMKRTAMNDGSKDNIIDYANCFNVQLPVTVTANGIPLVIEDNNDYNLIESVFDTYDDDNDTLEIHFPITLILNDFSQVMVYSTDELNTYSSNCNGENEMDDDIECIDFQYPISASIFDINNELIYTETLTSDKMMYQFINDLDGFDIVAIDFPMTVDSSDNTHITVNNLVELKNTIESFANSCDEDDDFDYNDDDCNGCSPLQLTTILTNCSDWMVDKLERNGNNYDNAYDGYSFNFFTDGTVSVAWNATIVYGTWTANGTENDITVDIDIPSLPYCNLNWNLHEIAESPGETKIDLRLGDDDRMRYESNCN